MRSGAVTDEAGSFLLEEIVDDGMLHETTDERLIYASSTAKIGERDSVAIGDV